tara:strand:+ start:2646 stop:2852 length:207 start_codon:yes stop_codon:yes gene_type:complete
MKKNKKEALKLIITLNLILGVYNLFLFSQNFLIFNLLVGSANIGVWVFFRDMKLIPILLKYNKIRNHH